LCQKNRILYEATNSDKTLEVTYVIAEKSDDAEKAFDLATGGLDSLKEMGADVKKSSGIKKTLKVFTLRGYSLVLMDFYKLKRLERNSSYFFTQAVGGFNRPHCLSCMFVLHRSVLLCSFYGFILKKKSVCTMAHLLTN